MLGLFQRSPAYKGEGQPAASGGGGVLGVLAGLFGGGSCLFPGTPAYRKPTVMDPADQAEQSPEPGSDPEKGPNGQDDPQPVTIVIRRGA